MATPEGRKQSHVKMLHLFPGALSTPRRWQFTTETVNLLKISNEEIRGDIHEDSCKEIEKKLGHIPDGEALERCYRKFSWEHRTLVKVRYLKAGKNDGVKLADYLMYVCLDKVENLQLNEYLEELVPGAPKVYGSAFIFKKTTGTGESEYETEIARYLESSDDDFGQEMEFEFFQERILKKLMKAVGYASSAKKGVDSPPHGIVVTSQQSQ